MTDNRCTCYVQGLPSETRFALRRGAHAETCPIYRRSVDPLDAVHDAAFRNRVLAWVSPKYKGCGLAG